MDAYEATKMVFSRIQRMDPENAAKIMGLLLLQDHGEKEMIRLAFGPESLLQSVVFDSRQELGLLPPSSPNATTPAVSTNTFFLSRQNSDSRLLASPWNQPVSSPSSRISNPPFSRVNGADDFIDGVKLNDQLSFFNETVGPKAGNEVFHPEEFRNQLDAEISPDGSGWCAANALTSQYRSCSISKNYLSIDPAGLYFKPCLYFARGYCKNGSSCRFLHSLPDEASAAIRSMDTVVEQEILHRSLGQRVVASAAGAFPYSPTGSLPLSPSATSKCMNFLLQQQHSESQRLMAASAAATTFMVGRNDPHNFLSRPMVERSDFAGMFNPSSRQIYLTFPADSTFREEDVSNYFSIYGPVQDVRIPYQQKRMFGFVTFVYPETVKLILAKGNPHFVCNARVLVKPYKEKGKIPDKYRKLQGEGVDFSGGSIPAGLDSRDPCDDQQQLGTRTLLGISNQDAVLMRKLEQHQELQQAIELQQRRIMGLHLLDLKRNLIAATATAVVRPPPPLPLQITASLDAKNARTSSDGDKSPIPECFSLPRADQEVIPKEDGGFQQSVEHNLPDSPFASLNKSSITAGDSCMVSVCSEAEGIAPSAPASTSASSALLVSSLLPATSTLEKSFTSCFLQMPRFSSGQGAMGL